MLTMPDLYLDSILPYGKYKGEEVEDVLEDNPQYLVACVEYDTFNFAQEVITIMENRKLI